RPINALVDITNLMTFDQNRPLHVFDAAKVKGNLVIRRAKAGESVLALDGRTYALEDSMVVIADDHGVESIAGIMGGEVSGCDENTTDVLIEAALWNPLNIARSGRALGINSDARYRNERGIDPAFNREGMEMATQMVLDFCGGTPSDVFLAGEIPDPSRIIEFPWSETKRLTGLEVPRAEAKFILEQLGFHVSGQADRVKVAPPSWRADIEGKADLVEEITRIAGLDRVESRPLPREEAAVAVPVLTLLQKRTRLAKRTLAARGLVEAVTWSFIGAKDAEAFGAAGAAAQRLKLANPIAADLSDMRPSLLPGLLKAAQRNADRGFGDVALFEVGQIFRDDDEKSQFMAACAVRRGTARGGGVGRHWDGAAKNVDVFDAKADAFAMLASLGIPVGGLQVVPGGPDYFHPGRSAKLQFGPKMIVGAFGELHPRTLAALDVKGPVVAFEILLDLLPPPKAKPTKVKPKLGLSDFQPVTRDFAFVVARDVAAGDLVKTALAAERALITDVGVFDIYEGAGVGDGKKSVALEVTLQPRDKTLTDAEIDAVAAKIIAEIGKRYNATLRA
ncbi:MAG: phenylalanine--tRNA ligase subunit beta, partial [Beijerinckiaceae bacterium]